MASVEKDTPAVQYKWTFETLLAHVTALLAANDKRYQEVGAANDLRYEQRFSDSKTAIDAALNAAKEAVAKAESAAEKRFESVNEFRGTLTDQQRTLMPRMEAESQFSSIQKSIDELKRTNYEQRGMGTARQDVWGYLVGAIGVLIAVASLVVRFVK